MSGERYVGSFGRQWTWFKRTQLDHPDQGLTASREAFTAKTGWTAEDVKDRLVLDAGCGMGRFAEVASSWGARVIAADLSGAVLAAAENLPVRESVALLHADLFDLPLKEASFDRIYSLGVLHHTPDAEAAFHALVPLLRPGG